MRKNILFMAMAVVLCVSVLTGCQEAPETSESNGIEHAQGAMDQQISDIAVETPGQQSAGVYEGTIGTTDNKMNIKAQIPVIPENMYQITLKPDDNLDMDTLTAFLDSRGGNIVDTSEELSKEMEANEIANTTGDEPVFYSLFGDHSALELSDGNKTASFTHCTWAYYIDNDLREKCLAIYKGNTTATLITPGKMNDGSFSAEKATEILLEKLNTVGVSEIAFDKIYYNEGDDYSYYEFQFSPAYNGIAVNVGYNSYFFGQVSPIGFANVSRDGVADMSLMDFLSKAVEKEPVSIISFEQTAKILEQYLDSGMIEADSAMTYSRAELKYYPVPNPAPKPEEIEYKPVLVLIPIWHIYMPLDDYIDGHYTGPSTICINAITGELIND